MGPGPWPGPAANPWCGNMLFMYGNPCWCCRCCGGGDGVEDVVAAVGVAVGVGVGVEVGVEVGDEDDGCWDFRLFLLRSIANGWFTGMFGDAF
jgi:hypothetical protein